MAEKKERLEGYLVDLACLRKYSPGDWAELGPTHSKQCSLMGHCVESGFGLVGPHGALALLDPDATPGVVQRLRESEGDRGIRLRVTREERDGEMKTVSVEKA